MENRSYYLEQLYQQTYMLIESCHNYDSGTFFQAKNMSAIIRTLVKDIIPRKNSKYQTVSLLKSLEAKDTMEFYNTGFEATDPLININLVVSNRSI